MVNFRDYRPLHPGMGQAVAERTYLRKKNNGDWETWGDVADRVSLGNSLLCKDKKEQKAEQALLRQHIANGTLLLSGRHLQHGDENQPQRNLEIFTNCSTSASSFVLFYLLLNGSGVGRCYDDDMMLVNWDYAPNIRCVIDHEHADFDWSAHESLRDAKHKYGTGRDVMWFEVPDSREGWAKALEIWENSAFEKVHANKLLILDFSKVRPKGSPIGGMQNRPSSGPVPLMNAFGKAATLKGAGLERWRQALYIDHYFAECVLVGGARRCMPEGTVVTLRDGAKHIEDVMVGDIVVTPKGEKSVTAVFDQGIQETVLIRHAFGELECTPNHQVAVFNSYSDWGFKRADEIERGDRIVFDPSGWDYQAKTSLPNFILGEKSKSRHNTTGVPLTIPPLDEEIAWLIGLVHGDGYIEKTKDGHGRIRIGVHLNDREVADKAAEQLDRFGGKTSIKKVPNENRWEICCHGVQLTDYFFEHVKQPNKELNIPTFIAKGTRDIRWAYLAGLFDADGSTKTRPINMVTTVYPHFAKEVMNLLLSLGVLASSRKIIPPNENWKDKYYINIKSMENINKVRSMMRESVRFEYNVAHSSGGFNYQTSSVRNELGLNKAVAPNKTVPLARITEKTRFKAPAGYPVAVLEVVDSGRAVQTYDIEVADIHQFTANGFIVHNSARMSTKSWKDLTVMDFITVKRPIEYDGMNMEEILELRSENPFPPTGFLWSSNNSIAADEEFWKLNSIKRNEKGFHDDIAKHARRVMRKLCEASYADGTGEPGIINVDKLVQKEDGWNTLTTGDYVGSKKYQLEEETELYMSRLARKAKRKKYHMVTNPCGEIALTILGGYCTIADVVPFHADTLDEAEEAFRAAVRALIRVNTMDCLYMKEVQRTNRIGVGMTGVIEFAWKFFGYGFRDLVDEEKSKDFWLTLARFNQAVYDEAVSYSKQIGVSVPHTMTTIKPAGTTSKLFGLCEGWHLPSMKWYVRWVQFRDDDPLIAKYQDAGYPVRELKSYRGHVIVGFPTQPVISSVMPENKLVTAGEATPEEQYQWLMLGEKYWIHGTDGEGNPVTDRNIGNQISYTLKYLPDEVDYKNFREMLIKYQSQIRCCSVMPQSDTSSYEYQPEQPVNKAEYEKIAHAIQQALEEDIGKEHVDCDSGACPIDFRSNEDVKAA